MCDEQETFVCTIGPNWFPRVKKWLDTYKVPYRTEPLGKEGLIGVFILKNIPESVRGSMVRNLMDYLVSTEGFSGNALD